MTVMTLKWRAVADSSRHERRRPWKLEHRRWTAECCVQTVFTRNWNVDENRLYRRQLSLFAERLM